MDLFRLTDLETIEKRKYGTAINNLHELFVNGISIIETLVISNALFENFKSDNSNTKAIALISDEIVNIFGKYNSIAISYSINKEIFGILSFSNIKPNSERICEIIIDIYRSWFEEKARAYRITYSIIEEETYPAIIIQPVYSDHLSLVTRCPKTGEITNSINVNGNIHNTTTEFNKSHENLIQNIENALKRPVKFYFIEEKNQFSIISIENETMTIGAKWIAINDLYFKDIISKHDYITFLEPNMIYINSGVNAFSSSNTTITTLKGLPASPGISIGRLVLSNNKEDAFYEDAIFCCVDATPEDLGKMQKSVAIISSRGGMTSHSAVIGRGMGKPTVTSAPFKIDFDLKCLIYGDKIYYEKSNVCVDGNRGLIHLSEFDIVTETIYQAASNNTDFLRTALKIIKSISSQDNFGDLSIDFQLKIANLLSAFNKIQFVI